MASSPFHPIRNPVSYLLSAPEPWVKYNTLTKLLGLGTDDDEVGRTRAELVSHPKIKELIEECRTWPVAPLRRHNDAGHLIHKMALLADFGLKIRDPRIGEVVGTVLSHRSDDGMFLSSIKVAKSFGGDGLPHLSWLLCDAPTLLYALAGLGLADDERVKEAAGLLSSLVDGNGWRCRGSIPGFRGPGRKSDHCPYANLISLKALSMFPELRDSEACGLGLEAQLSHWENREGRKIYMFGIGSTFVKLKYPNVWYDVLHVVDVLSRFPAARKDGRFIEMLDLVNSKQREDRGFAPESVWRAFKGWSFGQKRVACSWITYRVALINRRMGRSFE